MVIRCALHVVGRRAGPKGSGGMDVACRSCQWPIFGYGVLYGVHCMSWVVELDPRVLGDECGMSFAASGNDLSLVTSYGL